MRATKRRSRAGTLFRPSCGRATGRSGPSPARWTWLWQPPTWSWAGPDRRRSPKWRRSGCPWWWFRIPMLRGTSGGTRRRWSAPERPFSSRTRPSTPRRSRSEVAAFGLPMVVVPYPHAAGHQRRNAEEMVRAGAALLVEDEAFDAQALLAAAAILDNPPERAAMAAAARSLARPGAASAVAELVMAAAERRHFPDPARIDAISRGVAS